MPERIYKLQPDRTVALRGFNSFAAAASIHSASPTGFKVSGTFRDAADFAVAVLYDADNYFEHPSIKYLPDFDFAGLTLNLSLNYTDGLQPIDSPKYNWIDWATLDCIREDGTRASVRLFDHAMLAGPDFPAATATVEVTTGSVVQPYDRVTLWFQNIAFDCIVPGTHPVSATFDFYAGTTGTVHSITVNGRLYPHTEVAGESGDDQARELARLINAAPDSDVSAIALENSVGISVRSGREGNPIALEASDGNAATTISGTSTAMVASQIAAAINVTDWAAQNTTHALLAASTGPQITITAARYGTVSASGTSVSWAGGSRFSGIAAGARILIDGGEYAVASVQSPKALTLTAPVLSPVAEVLYVAPRGGRDGNMIRICALVKNPDTLSVDQTTIQLSGGSSEVTWNCSIDFTALEIDRLRQCWLTFAPSLTDGGPYIAREWLAIFSNWELSGPGTAFLQVAGRGSVRIEEDDTACTYTGAWTREAGFYSKYFARATRDGSVTVLYTCQFAHSLYLGTSLYGDRAVVGVQLDGATLTPVNCVLATDSAVVTRRLLHAGVAPGRHSVTFTIQEPGVFYFDFLEAAVLSDMPGALAPRSGISPALDFDTDHTYKLPPARLMWMMDQLGYAGPMNEYLGVFWWNQRIATGVLVSGTVVSFGGAFVSGDAILLTVNDTVLRKDVYPADTLSTIALHFAAFINETFVGAWASASGSDLTISGRSPAAAYNLTLACETVPATGSTGSVVISAQPPPPGVSSDSGWVINDTEALPINRATRDWHADFYRECFARGREVVTACSLELVNPPAGYAAKFPGGNEVATSTGFGDLSSKHCAAGSSRMLAYQKAVYRCIAGMQAEAGLIPCVQYGEFLWWYFADAGGGMAFYDEETKAAALTALGRELNVFSTTSDDPLVNGGADAVFLRDRLRDHVRALVDDIRSAYPAVICEVLWPYDVNYPVPLAVAVGDPIGGPLNRFVNLPVEWQEQESSGLDRIKVEGLAFATGMRNINLARQAIGLFPGFGWPLENVRYLVPVFGSATPWNRELACVWAAGIRVANLWAFDHVCLFNLDVPEPALERRSFIKAV